MPLPRMTMRRAARAFALTAAAAGVLVSAACSGSPPPPPSKDQIITARRLQLMPLIVQCFAGQHLLTPGDLLDSQASPAILSSAWLRDGHVTRNTAFSNWYADKGAAITVRGTTIDTWVNDAAYDPATWPAGLCGPRPASVSATPTYQPPPAQ